MAFGIASTTVVGKPVLCTGLLEGVITPSIIPLKSSRTKTWQPRHSRKKPSKACYALGRSCNRLFFTSLKRDGTRLCEKWVLIWLTAAQYFRNAGTRHWWWWVMAPRILRLVDKPISFLFERGCKTLRSGAEAVILYSDCTFPCNW